jgi:RNA polymerase sigma factor (sigma-70 family)
VLDLECDYAGLKRLRRALPCSGRGSKSVTRNDDMPHEADEFLATRWSLINRLKDWDDQESWREFFELYWRLIYGVALKAELTPTEAQEAVQETIISVCKNIKAFRADPAYGSFKSWLLKLTRWRILDQIKKRPREEAARVHKSRGGRDDTSRTTSTMAQIPDPEGNALERIWDNEWERNVVTAALEKLERQSSARHYQIFVLHVIKQYPVEKVAHATGVNADQVYLIKHRLGEIFKKAIEEVEGKMK